MRQVTKEPKATQVNLFDKQRTELPPRKFPKKNKIKSTNQDKLQASSIKKINTKKECLRQMEDFTGIHKNIQVQKKDAANVVIPYIWRDLDVLQADYYVNIATNLGISASYVIRKQSQNTRKIQENPELINWWLEELL